MSQKLSQGRVVGCEKNLCVCKKEGRAHCVGVVLDEHVEGATSVSCYLERRVEDVGQGITDSVVQA